MLVTGTTAVVGIVGNPIVQVKSPGAMNQYFADHGLNSVLVPIEIARDAVPGFIATVRRWTNCKGIIVTVHYKQVVAPLLDRLTPRAERFSTVNVFRRDPDGTLTGEMFAGIGFVADVVTAPTMTPFLTLAKQRGCTTQTGLEMTETQPISLAAFMVVAAP